MQAFDGDGMAGMSDQIADLCCVPVAADIERLSDVITNDLN